MVSRSSLMSPVNYFDHNATAPMSQIAKDAWLDAVEKFPGNPSSLHRMGARADKALEDARQALASYLGCSPLDIVWTSGATESNNTVWHHVSHTMPQDAEVLVSAIEHPCTIESVARWLGHRVRWIPTHEDGVIDLHWLERQLKRYRPHLVSVMAANNETGCIQPWEKIRELCEAQSIEFFCDAAQWMGRLPAKGLGACDWVSGCAHKFGGPKGVGFLKCPAKGRMEPLLLGGPQELKRRAGTENVHGILSMLASLDDREKRLNKESVEVKWAMRHEFESQLQSTVPDIQILGQQAERLWNTTSVVMPEVDCRIRWVVKLDKLGFAVSTGSACSSGKEKTSHVLDAMGVKSPEASRVLRFSSGWETPLKSWMELKDALLQVYTEITGC